MEEKKEKEQRGIIKKDRSDCVLWARKLHGLFRVFSEPFRSEFGLKQIDLEILFFLKYNPSASIGEISRNQNLNKGQLSLAMNGLKEKGYIDTRSNDQDRRYQIYSLTSEAEKLWDRIVSSRDEMEEWLYRGFSDEERALFKSMVERLGDNIEMILEEKR